MTTKRTCDLCHEEVTDEEAQYDLDGRFEFRLVKAKRVKWWRFRKEVRDLDVCRDCVVRLVHASDDKARQD